MTAKFRHYLETSRIKPSDKFPSEPRLATREELENLVKHYFKYTISTPPKESPE